MSYENSSRFISAFIDIEKALNKIVKRSQYIPFYQLVDSAAQIEPYVKDIAVELKEYADLRNAIVHERIDGSPIAEPHSNVVLRLEKIRGLLLSPPVVKDYFIRDVVICQVTDLLSQVAMVMFQHSFSKLPVYDEDEFVGLLTAEAITYWLANIYLVKEDSIHRECVKDALKFIDQPDNHYFVRPSCTLFEVLGIFDEYRHQGKRLQALLITEESVESTGKGKLSGIITNFDLPLIYHVLEAY